MNPADKQAWLDALRSGKFTQAHGAFVSYGVDGDIDLGVSTKHCCLAVLAVACDGSVSDYEFEGLIRNDASFAPPVPIQSFLAKLNDGHIAAARADLGPLAASGLISDASRDSLMVWLEPMDVEIDPGLTYEQIANVIEEIL